MRTLLISLLMVCLATFAVAQDRPQTPLERHNYQQLSTNAELVAFLKKMADTHPQMTYEEIGRSVQGKPIPALLVTETGHWQEDKLRVMLFAQQHGNEASGKEALLMLISELAAGQHTNWLQNSNLLLLPQINPDGGDAFQRRNANDNDLNRDHLALHTPEVQALRQTFYKYLPHVSADIHEYYPFSQSWQDFGYRRNFDVQVGTLTNPNAPADIIHLARNEILPTIKQTLHDSGYSFLEYTLGHFPSGQRLRHSTADLNDGRQSIGMMGTLSFIYEGIRGRDSLHNIRPRVESQLIATHALLGYLHGHAWQVKRMVAKARYQLLTRPTGDSVAIRIQHRPQGDTLAYTLWDISQQRDTTFFVSHYHSRAEPTLQVAAPEGYLVPANDTRLTAWLKRAELIHYQYKPQPGDKVHAYTIGTIQASEDEGLKNRLPAVTLKPIEPPAAQQYLLVPVRQLARYSIVHALEPQAMYGLVNYKPYQYLLQSNSQYPVLRLQR